MVLCGWWFLDDTALKFSCHHRSWTTELQSIIYWGKMGDRNNISLFIPKIPEGNESETVKRNEMMLWPKEHGDRETCRSQTIKKVPQSEIYFLKFEAQLCWGWSHLYEGIMEGEAGWDPEDGLVNFKREAELLVLEDEDSGNHNTRGEDIPSLFIHKHFFMKDYWETTMTALMIMFIVSAFLPSLSFSPSGSRVIVKHTNEAYLQSPMSLQCRR